MFFKDARVLIIGGTGTIGKSLVNRILTESPKLVRVFSRDEYKQYLLQNEFGKRKDLQYAIADVRDYKSVLTAMAGMDYVFHTAAMKHIPACEYNPHEAVQTNILGTSNVINAAISQNVKKVVFSSSDKAISPTNTYGATKLIAERIIAATEYSNDLIETTFAVVRFGNVIGSRGSVIPLFVKQIIQKNRITVTDFNMTRFMMTIDQATDLIIKALMESKGGETFVLKMPVILLKDLVKVVTEEKCQKHNIDPNEIIIEEIGLRPGEKMYEELMTHDESTHALELPDMYIIPSIFSNNADYPLAVKAKQGIYASNRQRPLTIEEIRKLIKSENLI